MGITYRDLEQAYAQHKEQYGGSKEDYFALLYLTQEFDKSPEQVARHIAFGQDGAEGINAFHVDANRRNLYLYQFQFKKQYQAFQEPLRRLAHEGMERIFGPGPEVPGFLLAELRARLQEDPELIDRVLIHFVYNGDPSDADQSAILDSLREDLEAKKHRSFSWSATTERLVNAIFVVINSEFFQLSPQVDCVPDEHVVKKLPSYRPDQPFHERMGHGYVRDRLDLFDLEYAQVGEPTMETK